VPNVEQTMTVKIALMTLYSILPLICYLYGAWLFSKFKLDENSHAEIRAELEKRRASGTTVAD
jgi:Na+/melibiose symporter-like transporter